VSGRDASFAGREEFNSSRERVLQALAEIAVQSEGECAAVLTHGGFIRTIVVDVLRLSAPMSHHGFRKHYGQAFPRIAVMERSITAAIVYSFWPLPAQVLRVG